MSLASPVTAASIVVVLLIASSGWGADTVEAFDTGLSDFEVYTSDNGISSDEPTTALEACLGYGATPALSLFLALSFEADRFLASTIAFELGALGTPLDTNHLDLDLMFAAGTDGNAMGYSPGLELNLDLEPDLAVAGLYLRGGVDLFAAETATGNRVVSLAGHGTAGGYVTLGRHQLLVEFDATWQTRPAGESPAVDVGPVHLGHNLRVDDHLELISEISADVCSATNTPTYGLLVGLIATSP